MPAGPRPWRKGRATMVGEVSRAGVVRPGLALGLASLVVALLFLATGFLDLRRTEAALLDLVTARAEGLAAAMEAFVAELMDRALGGDDVLLSLDGAGRETTLYDAIAEDLLEAARALGAEPNGEGLGDRALSAGPERAVILAPGEGPEGISTLPPEVRGRLRPLLEGRAEVALDLFGSGRGAGSPRFAALALPGEGTVVVLLLDDEGFRRRALGVAVQAAAEAAGEHADVAYVEVADARGGVLGGIGQGVRPAPPPQGASGARIRWRGAELLEVSAAFRLGEGESGGVRVGLRADAVEGILSRNRLRIWLSTALLAGVCLFAVALLYGVQRRHHRELGEFQSRLSRAQRLSGLGRLAAALAHEIRNPLNALGLGLQRIQRELLPPEGEGQEALGRITALMRDEVRRLNALVEEFLAASPETRGPPGPLSLSEVVRQTLCLVEDEARARGVRVAARLPPSECRILGDRDKLRQALLNLLRNALEAIPGEGEVEVTLEVSDPRRVRIRIRDSGVGIPAQHRERIFDPDFTTKDQGLGLGLAVAHEIVSAHGGELRIARGTGPGTTVEMWFPLAGP